jgi:hypothetical protein
MVIEVIITSAMLCFDGACHPVLVGRETPRGEYNLSLFLTKQRVYGGHVLAFAQDRAGVYAVHRPPSERRRNLLAFPAPMRVNVTDGCINVTDAVYDALVACCDGATIVIR